MSGWCGMCNQLEELVMKLFDSYLPQTECVIAQLSIPLQKHIIGLVMQGQEGCRNEPPSWNRMPISAGWVQRPPTLGDFTVRIVLFSRPKEGMYKIRRHEKRSVCSCYN